MPPGKLSNLERAMQHLQDFIYYAYIFYIGVLEEPTEVADMFNDDGSGQGGLTVKAVSKAAADLKEASSDSTKSTKVMVLIQGSMIVLPRISDQQSLVWWKWNQRRNDGGILPGIGMPPGKLNSLVRASCITIWVCCRGLLDPSLPLIVLPVQYDY